MEVIQRQTLFDFHGVSMSETFINNWDEVQNFKARPDDILIATYPKAGGELLINHCMLMNASYAHSTHYNASMF